MKKISSQDGQAVTEYILILAIVVSLSIVASNGLARIGLMKKIMKPLSEDFARVYQYGHPQAKGYDDGGPENHPRADTDSGKNNFRMFISPQRK